MERDLIPDEAPAPPSDSSPLEPAAVSSIGSVDEDIRAVRPYVLGRSPLHALMRRTISVLSLVALDLCGLTLGVYMTLVVRQLWIGDPVYLGVQWRIVADWLPFLALITLLVFWRAGLYAVREFRSGFGAVPTSIALVAAITLAFGVSTGQTFSTYLIFPTAAVLATLFVGVLRGSYDVVSGAMLEAFGVRRKAVLVGAPEELAHLRALLGRSRRGIRYAFLGVVGTDPGASELPRLGSVADLPLVLRRHEVDELIVNDADFSERQLLDLVEIAHRRGVRVSVAPSTTELLARRAQYVPGQAVPLFQLRPPMYAGTDWVVKRAFDLLVGGAVLVLGTPLWLLIAAAIRLDSPGPVLYRDRRVGLGEREFRMVKFRTMRAGAADMQPALEHANEAEGALFKIRDDPRVTRVGRVLRRLSIDEMPNLVNVVRGEMSLVGPRPLPIRDFERLEPWHRKRYHVLPGMTGLWQISGRSSLGFDDLVRLDFFYLEHWSIWLDIQILLKTVPAVLGRRGAY